MYLLGLEVTDDGVDVVEDLVDEGHHLAHLHLDKVAPALLGDLDEGVARHVLHAVVSLCQEQLRSNKMLNKRNTVGACSVLNALKRKPQRSVSYWTSPGSPSRFQSFLPFGPNEKPN